MWKHSSKSQTANNHDYGIRDHQQRNTRDEKTHFGHQGNGKEIERDIRDASSSVWRRNLPHGTIGLRMAFHPPHLAGLSGQGHYSPHPNRRENPLPPLRHQPTTAR